MMTLTSLVLVNVFLALHTEVVGHCLRNLLWVFSPVCRALFSCLKYLNLHSRCPPPLCLREVRPFGGASGTPIKTTIPILSCALSFFNSTSCMSSLTHWPCVHFKTFSPNLLRRTPSHPAFIPPHVSTIYQLYQTSESFQLNQSKKFMESTEFK